MKRCPHLPSYPAMWTVLILGLFPTLLANPASGQDVNEESVPKDSCIVELILPEGATVTIDGKDYGKKRRLVYNGLHPGTTYVSHLVVRFPDGKQNKYQVFVEAGRTIRLCEPDPGMKRPEIVLQRGYTGELICAALSPNERYLVTGGEERVAVLWDVATGRRLREFGGHSRRVTRVSFASDSRSVLTTSLDGTIFLWDITTGRRIRSFHSDSQYCPQAALSPDDRFVALNSQQGVVLLDVDTGTHLRVFQDDENEVRALAFSPDASHLLTGHRDGACVLWEIASGRKVWTSHELKWAVDFVLFSPDGHRVLAMSPNPHVAVIWDVQTGRKQLMLFGGILPCGRAQPAVFSPDSRRLLMTWGRGAVIWDLSTGHMIDKYGTYVGIETQPMVLGVMFTSAGQPLTLASETSYGSSRMSLVDVDKGRTICVFHAGTHRLRTIAASPDGRHLAGACTWKEATAVLWDAASGRQVRTFGQPLHDGQSLKTRLLLVDSGSEVEGHGVPISSVAFDPSGQQLLTAGGTDGTAVVWEINSGRQVRRLRRHRPQHDTSELLIAGVRFHRALQLASSRNLRQLQNPDETLGLGKVWRDLEASLKGFSVQHPLKVEEAWRRVQRFEEATLRYSEVLDAEYWRSVDTEAIITQEGAPSVEEASRAMNIHLQKLIANSSPETKGWVEFVAFSPEGRHAIAGSHADEKADIWDARTGQQLQTLQGHSGGVYCVAFSPDGRYALTGSGDGQVTLWETMTAKKVRTFRSPVTWSRQFDLKSVFESVAGMEDDYGDAVRAHERANQLRGTASSVASVGFSPDGRQVLASFRDDTAVLWETATGKTLHILRTDQSQHRPIMTFHPAAFRPDGRYVATGESDGTVVLWDANTGHLSRKFVGHEGEVTCLAFFPDGQRLASGSSDGTIRLWDLNTGEQLAMLISFGGGRDWLTITREGLFDGSAGGREKVMFRVGGGLNVVPVDRFFQDFYYPGLLSAIWRGERPLPKVEMGQSLPPKVRILAPEKGGLVENNQAIVEIEAVDEGGGVRGPWLVQNGTRILAPEKTERIGKTVRRAFEVALVEGENKLEFHAASADGSWESEPALITLRYERPLPKPELYLVTVGVNRYADESLNLGFAAGDAQAMAELFRQRGPALYKEIHTTTLLDEEATASAILESLHEIAQKAQPQDTVAVYLDGHGAVVGQQYYFLPHEFHHRAGTLEEDVRRQGLSAGTIQEALVAIPALKRVVVFDTGQSGDKVELARTARDPFAFRGAIERLSRASGAFMIASAAVSDDAREVPELGHGVLSYALLAGLHAVDSGPLEKQWIRPAGKDRVADVLDWFGFASAHVPQLTKRYFGRQQELQHSSLGASFPILPVPASSQPAPKVVAVDSPPASQPTPPSISHGSGKADLFLVAVGINQYRDESMNLKFACDDARAIADLFRRRSKRLYRNMSAAEVLDGRATREGILQTVEKVARKAQPEDTLVVFLSGHGRMVGQRYYFIPHEFGRKAENIEEDIRQQGLPADVLADAVAKAPARKRLLIFDTCASGGALSISQQGETPFAFRGAIEKLGERQGVFTIAASAAGQEAQEIESLGHGVLTYALLAGLRAVPPGGPLEGLTVQPNGPEGLVDVLEWFSFTSGHVPRLTQRYLHRKQEVQTSAQGTSFSVLPAW